MKTFLVSAALRGHRAHALRRFGSGASRRRSIAVVDLEKVTTDCNACKTATAALQAQVDSLKSRQQQLATPLQTEGKSIQAAIDALNGKQPDAALQARVKAFQPSSRRARRRSSASEQQIQRNQAYIQQQISAKLGPIYQQVMTRRGANVLLETGATLATTTRRRRHQRRAGRPQCGAARRRHGRSGPGAAAGPLSHG